MTINRINFKSSLLTQMQQQAKPVALNQVVAQPQQPAKAKQVNKTLIASGVVSGLLLILGIIKRKSITTFFKKLLNKTNIVQEEIKPTQNIEKQLEEKLKILPKPNFTCTPESDPDKYFKERRNYASSLKKYTRYADEDIVCKAIELIGKYGCTERHIESIAGFAGTSEKEPRIVRAFVTAVADFGDSSYSGLISDLINEEKITKYDDESIKAILKGLARIGNKEEIEIIENYLAHENKEIKQLAQTAIAAIQKSGRT